MRTVLVVVVGIATVVVLVGLVILFAVRGRDHSGARGPLPSAAPTAPPPPPAPADGTWSAITIKPGDREALESLPPDLRAVVEAMEDGQLSDEERGAFGEGVEVHQFGTGQVSFTVASTTRIELQGPDGAVQRYDNIDDIPDPAIRELVRRAKRDHGRAEQDRSQDD